MSSFFHVLAFLAWLMHFVRPKYQFWQKTKRRYITESFISNERRAILGWKKHEEILNYSKNRNNHQVHFVSLFLLLCMLSIKPCIGRLLSSNLYGSSSFSFRQRGILFLFLFLSRSCLLPFLRRVLCIDFESFCK